MLANRIIKSLGKVFLPPLKRLYSAAAYTGRYEYETLAISSPSEYVLHVEINRPDIYNALNRDMFRELLECFKSIHDDKHCRVVVISGAGKLFSAGLDYEDLNELMATVSGANSQDTSTDVARKAKFIRSIITSFQESFSAIERCNKPVIASIHGGCIGAAMSIASACDIRFCSQDAYFQIKEVDTGFAADMGTLQRMPKIIGNDSLMRELVYTSRKMYAQESKEMGLVSKVLADCETTKQSAIELAQQIATKSPVAVQGSKMCLKYSRDHSIWDGLRFMANWNMVMLQSEDMLKSAAAVASKSDEQPNFSEL